MIFDQTSSRTVLTIYRTDEHCPRVTTSDHEHHLAGTVKVLTTGSISNSQLPLKYKQPMHAMETSLDVRYREPKSHNYG